MKNVRPAFEIHEGTVDQLVGYQKIKCHMIFDVKLGENFRRKARLVAAGGHVTEVPSSMTYSSVVSRDSNAYLSAPCREKIYCVAGPEFGSDVGKTMVVVKKALYGLKSSGASFRAMLAQTIYDIGYRPSKADPDVWMRPATKPDGTRYYEYVLCYVDDVISISGNPMEAIEGIKAVFKLKDDDKAEVPAMYLGAGVDQVKTVNGTRCWALPII
eukprot:scaffold5838_cov169-Cylindrotheca_fusiformis.AAC.1